MQDSAAGFSGFLLPQGYFSTLPRVTPLGADTRSLIAVGPNTPAYTYTRRTANQHDPDISESKKSIAAPAIVNQQPAFMRFVPALFRALAVSSDLSVIVPPRVWRLPS